jgi:hypothetical protein
MRSYGALFLMHKHVPLWILKASDMLNLAFEVVRGHYFRRCWRTGQVRHALQRHS